MPSSKWSSNARQLCFKYAGNDAQRLATALLKLRLCCKWSMVLKIENHISIGLDGGESEEKGERGAYCSESCWPLSPSTLVVVVAVWLQGSCCFLAAFSFSLCLVLFYSPSLSLALCCVFLMGFHLFAINLSLFIFIIVRFLCSSAPVLLFFLLLHLCLAAFSRTWQLCTCVAVCVCV